MFPPVIAVTYSAPLLICGSVGHLYLEYDCPEPRHGTRGEHLFLADVRPFGTFPGRITERRPTPWGGAKIPRTYSM